MYVCTYVEAAFGISDQGIPFFIEIFFNGCVLAEVLNGGKLLKSEIGFCDLVANGDNTAKLKLTELRKLLQL